MWLLCWYTAEERAAEASTSFRAAELRSLAVLCGVDPSKLHVATIRSTPHSPACFEVDPGQDGVVDATTAPRWVTEVMTGRSVDPTLVPVYFDTDLPTAARIARRSVLMRALLEIWGTGVGLARCVAATRTAGGGGCPSCCREEIVMQSFRMSIAGIGCHLNRDQQREAIDALLPVSGMRGTVRMKGAECVLWYIADRWEAQALAHRRRQGKIACINAINGGASVGAGRQGDTGSGSAPTSHSASDVEAGEELAGPQETKDFVVFGLEVSCGSRHLMEKLALSDRKYLGPTTMAPSTGANLHAGFHYTAQCE